MFEAQLHSFFDELEKIAFGPTEAGKVLGVAKKFRMPKAALKAMPAVAAGGGLAAMPAAKTMTREAKQLPGKLISYGVPQELAEAAGSAAATQQGMSIARKLQRPVIFGRTSNIQPFLSKSPVAESLGLKPAGEALKTLDPKNKKMVNALLTGHELAEATVPGRAGFGPYGHRSPEVMLQEHNMLTTMPEGFEPARQALRGIHGHEANILSSHGIDLGRSPRLSRHARRHVTNIIEGQAEEQLRHQVERAKQIGAM